MIARPFFLAALSTLLLLPVPACKDDGKTKTTDPESESDENADPIEILEGIQVEVQAQIDLVLQPITDATQLLEDISTMPERFGITLGDLKGMASAAYSDGEVTVSVEIDIVAEAKAELEATLQKIKDIGIGIKATPERAAQASVKLTALSGKLTTVATSATAKLNAKLALPVGVSAEAKQDAQAQVESIAGLKASITEQIADAKATVTGLPGEATAIGVKLVASFAGAGKAGTNKK